MQRRNRPGSPARSVLGRLAALPATPAFVYDEARTLYQLERLGRVRARCGLKLLYSVKALPFAPLLELIAPNVDGFAVSSPFEARLTAETAPGQAIHLTSPGLRAEDMALLGQLNVTVSFNSLSQYRRLRPLLGEDVDVGLRVNPGYSCLDDPRYDPCRAHSKLGVPLAELCAALEGDAALAADVRGLHFHTAFESRSLAPLEEILRRVEAGLGSWLERLSWLNLGGGYLFDSDEELCELTRIVTGLRQRWPVDVFCEPGKALVGAAGYLVASVIDLFESDGKTVAVLDTSINHLPAVFEYQSRPPLLNEADDGAHHVLLAGGTCLSGDVFGEYRLRAPPRIGERVVFSHAGAYTLAKAHRFNGHNLPDIYSLDAGGELTLRQRFSCADYLRQWRGGSADVA
jgi:carboxynorspermidine decarboxylase